MTPADAKMVEMAGPESSSSISSSSSSSVGTSVASLSSAAVLTRGHVLTDAQALVSGCVHTAPKGRHKSADCAGNLQQRMMQMWIRGIRPCTQTTPAAAASSSDADSTTRTSSSSEPCHAPASLAWAPAWVSAAVPCLVAAVPSAVAAVSCPNSPCASGRWLPGWCPEPESGRAAAAVCGACLLPLSPARACCQPGTKPGRRGTLPKFGPRVGCCLAAACSSARKRASADAVSACLRALSWLRASACDTAACSRGPDANDTTWSCWSWERPVCTRVPPPNAMPVSNGRLLIRVHVHGE